MAATTTKDTTGDAAPADDGRPIPLTDREKATAAASTTDEKAATFTLPSGAKVTATSKVRDALRGK